ncbi:MAG: alpha/beta hydrolase [Verrucomicrobia bacterium]|nr:alpha/beta hydrolase [Verrucomicrobiota bacterium]
MLLQDFDEAAHVGSLELVGEVNGQGHGGDGVLRGVSPITDDDRIAETFDAHLVDAEVAVVRGGLRVVQGIGLGGGLFQRIDILTHSQGRGKQGGGLDSFKQEDYIPGMSFWKRHGKALAAGLGVLGVVVAGLGWLAASFLADLATRIPPTARPALNPARLGLMCEEVELRTDDGKRIAAWWMPQGDRSAPPVVVLHGLGASKAHMIDYILFAQKEKHPVLAIDFRGHGESDPSLTSIGYYESHDVLAGMKFVRERGAGDPVLWGTSMGAVSALLAAERDGAAAGVIADAPFDTYRNTIVHHAKLMYGLPEFPLIDMACPMIEKRVNFPMAEVDCLRAASRIRAPMLVLAGERDERMPAAMVHTIYERAAGPKDFWIIPGEGHENREFGQKFRDKIAGFLGKIRRGV